MSVTLIKSLAGRTERQRQCVRGLGLRRLHHRVEVADTPATRGMANKIADMLIVERVQ